MKDFLRWFWRGGSIPLGRRHAWGRSPSMNKRALMRAPSRANLELRLPCACRSEARPSHLQVLREEGMYITFDRWRAQARPAISRHYFRLASFLMSDGVAQ